MGNDVLDSWEIMSRLEVKNLTFSASDCKCQAVSVQRYITMDQDVSALKLATQFCRELERDPCAVYVRMRVTTGINLSI